MGLLQGLDDIRWGELKHAYGTAEDVPGLLKEIETGPDSLDAIDELDTRIYHQGGTVCSAATAALPYLVALAESPRTTGRVSILDLIGRLAAEAETSSHVDPEWPAAWALVLPRILALLDDSDTGLRRELASTLAQSKTNADIVVLALRDHYAIEEDDAVRLGTILAVGDLATGCTVEVLPETLTWLRDLSKHNDPQLCMAADIALGKAIPAHKPNIDTLLDALRSTGITAWRGAPWFGYASPELAEFFGGFASGLLGWTARALEDGPRTNLCVALMDHDDSDRRIGAVRVAADLLSEHRSPIRALLPGLAERSTDTASAARTYATHLLAALDEGDPDLLAARLEDDARLSRHGDARIYDLAAWGLAWRRDPRCVPRLVERLIGDDLYLNDVFYGPSGPFTTAPPSLRHVLAPLAAHADELLPPIRGRLTDPDIGVARGLAEVLADWGPAAASAVPQLVQLIGTEATPAAARALAAIGPAAATAAQRLSRPPHFKTEWLAEQTKVTLPWALWKVIGDPAPTLAAVKTAFEQDQPRQALPYVADLGPLASAHTPHLRSLLNVRNDWTRIEAAHAYWRVTGDYETAANVLSTEVYELVRGHALPVRWAAMRFLAEMGPATPSLQWALHEILDSDRRHRHNSGWRAFTEDRELRTLATQLLNENPQP